MALTLGQRAQRRHCGQSIIAELTRRGIAHRGQAGALRWRLAGLVLAGQQSTGQREIGEEADAGRITVGKHLVLGLPIQQAVLILHTGEVGTAWDGRRFFQHGPGEIGATDFTHLALVDQVAQCTQRLGDRGLGVGGMQLVEVDAVGAQAGQAVLDRGADVGGGRSAFVTFVGHAELGGQDDLVAPGAEGGSEVALALAPAVDVGGVEERDAGTQRGADHGIGLLAADAHAEVVAAQAHHADGE